LPSRRASEHDPAMRTSIRSLTRLAVLLPMAMLSACGSDEGGSDAMSAAIPPGQEYVVGFGETIRVGGLSLEFTTLAEESRCPTTVVCVWEGNARVLITAKQGSATGVLELNSNPRFPVRALFADYAIELRRVDPYPAAHPPAPVQDYTVTLFVEFARLQ
jgi:hypothetical protein